MRSPSRALVLAIVLLSATACRGAEGGEDAPAEAAVDPSKPVEVDPEEADEVADPRALLREYGTLLSRAAVSGGDALERTLLRTAAETHDPDCAPGWAHELLREADDVEPAAVVVDHAELAVGAVEVPVTVEAGRALHLGGDCEGPLPQPERASPPDPVTATPEEPTTTPEPQPAPEPAPAPDPAPQPVPAPQPAPAPEPEPAPQPAPAPVPTEPRTVTITGGSTLTGQPYLTGSAYGGDHRVGDPCHGRDGYDDFRSGMNVVIEDGSGATIGTAFTGSPQLADAFPSLEALYCQATFEVEVPASDFYRVEVGHRGGISLSHAELAADGFEVWLSLGG